VDARQNLQLGARPVRRLRERLSLKDELLLALMPTGIIRFVLAFVEVPTAQRPLFASLASSAILINVVPQHGANGMRALVLGHTVAALAGFAAYVVLGPECLAAGAAMVLTIGPIILLDAVHSPAVAASLAFAFRTGDVSNLVLFLLAACVVTLLLPDLIDAAVIAAVLLINAGVGFVQERKAERSVRALMKLVSPRARVLRDGQERELDRAGSWCPGTWCCWSQGCAYSRTRLLSATTLTLDESLLTGESFPVHNRTEPVAQDTPVAERSSNLYAGTVAATGRARAVVVATGERTELGRRRCGAEAAVSEGAPGVGREADHPSADRRGTPGG
jgi:cation transport ATPase